MHATYTNEESHTYKRSTSNECMSAWAVSHTRTCHVTCHTHERAMWHVTHTNVPCDMYEKAMSHTRMIHTTCRIHHVTHMNQSCRIWVWAMSDTWVGHVPYMTRPFHIGVSMHTWVYTPIWIGLFIYVTHDVWTSLVTHMYEPCQTHEWATCDIYE